MSIDSISSSYGSYADYTEMQKNLFKKMDADSDGLVTKDEFSAAKPDDVSDHQDTVMFTMMDENEDGVLTESEMTAKPPMPPGGMGGPREMMSSEDSLYDIQSEY